MAYHHRLRANDGRRLSAADFVAAGFEVVSIGGKNAVRCAEDFYLYESVDWFAERLSDDQILELVRIADRMGAAVIGDEDETYAIADDKLVERMAPPDPALSLFLRRNRWVIIYGLVLTATLVTGLICRSLPS